MGEKAILWPHIGGGGASPHLAVLREWQPGGALILDPDRNDVLAFREAVPGATVVGRIWRDDAEVRARVLADPLGAAAWADDLVMRHPARGVVDYWQIANEVCQQDWGEFQKLVEFECARARLAARHDYRLAMFGFSTGQPDLPAHDRLGYWRATYAALDLCAADGHVVAAHQYGWPDLWGPESKGGAQWLINRLEEQVLPRLPEKYRGVQFVVTEWGLDGHLVEPGFVGFRGRVSEAEYVRQMTVMAPYLRQFRERILGYCIFTLGAFPPWEPYDIAGGVARGVARYFAGLREPVVPDDGQAGKGATVTTRIVDLDGSVRDAAWLRANYGAVIVPAATGERRLALAEVRITEGPAALVVEVRDGTGRPLRDVAVAFWWPDAPEDLTSEAARVLRTRFKDRAAVQWTDGGGCTGFGLGTGAYVTDLGVGGPHAAWLLHDEFASDALDRLGMLAGTNHRGPLRLVFQVAEAAVIEPEQPTSFLARLRGAGLRVVDERGQLPHGAEDYPERPLSRITHLVVHHSAGAQTSVAALAAYHVRQGWPGIGYQVVVDEDGTVHLCHDLTVASYHCGVLTKPGDENAYTVGVCCQGNRETAAVPEAQWQSLQKVLGALQAELGAGRSEPLQIVGHKDINPQTLCPGKFLYARLFPLPATDVEGVLRNAAWLQAGVAYNPEAALAKFARENGLGVPVTGETDVTVAGVRYRLQGYANGVAYAVDGDWRGVKRLAW